MATLKKYDIQGNEKGVVEVGDSLLEKTAHPQLVKDYIVAIRANGRQWSANTKTRAQINRTGRKPHPQKGQGRSRQGDLAAPQYKGGGVVFGPKPKFDQHIRMNKKERQAAIRSLLVEKIRAGQVCVLEKTEWEAPKTQKMAQFFLALGRDRSRTLVLTESKAFSGNMEFAHGSLVKSFRNLPKKHHAFVSQINGYDLACCQDLVVLDSAWEEFVSILGVS